MMKPSSKASNLNRLIALFGKKKKLLVLTVLLTGLQVWLTVYLPVLVGRVLDLAVEAQAKEAIMALLGKILLLIILNTALQWSLPLIYNQLIYGAIAGLRQDVLMKLYKLPFSSLDQQSVGDLVARVTADSEQLSNGLIMVFNQLFIGFLTIFWLLFSMARLDVMAFLLVLCLTPISLFLAKYIAGKSYRFYQHQAQSRGSLAQVVEETLSQQSLIQAFQAQDQILKNYRDLNRIYSQDSQGATFYASIINPVTRFVNALIYAILAAFGGWRIIQGQLSLGELTTLLSYANQYNKPFNEISSVFAEWQSALASSDRMFAFLDQDDLEDDGSIALVENQIKGAIAFQNISFRYRADQPLLEDVSLSIPAGSQVAIVGPTGAGKSTLINLLMRFYEVDSGEILLDGSPIRNYSLNDLRAQMGMVLQETWLKEATIHDNIAYGRPGASREDVIAAAKAARADFFIRQLPQGYDTYLSAGSGSLSQGQVQLIAIARVFLKAPKLLILDEATSSIDSRTESLIQASLADLMEHRTSFVIAHRLATIRRADLILVMVAGQIVEWGPHDDLLAKPGYYAQMLGTQS